MENFTPLSAIIGGALIGLSAALLMALNGRIAGVSGVFSGIAFAGSGERGWRVAFIAGLIAAPVLYALFRGSPAPFQLEAGYPTIVAAGLLVGFGARLGSGCTSGHGVCGLSRLSPRSMASVGLFMGFGMATVAIMKTVGG